MKKVFTFFAALTLLASVSFAQTAHRAKPGKKAVVAPVAAFKAQFKKASATAVATNVTKAVGDTISVRKPPVTYSFRILKTIEQRVGAKLLPEIYENVTPPDQYELLEMTRISGFVDRARGTGRPTKKDRRAMDAFTELSFDSFDFDE